MSTNTKKYIVASLLWLFSLLFLPFILIRCAEPYTAMGGALLLFFGIHPALSLGIGILCGTDLRRLWWFPLVLPLLFPPLFSLVILDFTLELYIYSIFYLAIGVFFALLSHLTKTKISKQRKSQK